MGDIANPTTLGGDLVHGLQWHSTLAWMRLQRDTARQRPVTRARPRFPLSPCRLRCCHLPRAFTLSRSLTRRDQRWPRSSSRPITLTQVRLYLTSATSPSSAVPSPVAASS